MQKKEANVNWRQMRPSNPPLQKPYRISLRWQFLRKKELNNFQVHRLQGRELVLKRVEIEPDAQSDRKKKRWLLPMERERRDIQCRYLGRRVLRWLGAPKWLSFTRPNRSRRAEHRFTSRNRGVWCAEWDPVKNAEQSTTTVTLNTASTPNSQTTHGGSEGTTQIVVEEVQL